MLIKIYEKNNSQDVIDNIVAVLKDGGVMIYPTDTTYAIGCCALKERAVEKICRIKGIDPSKHYLSIVAADLSHIAEYAKVDNVTFRTLKRNLPGPFTFILNPSSHLPKIFRGRKEVGIRVPDCEIVRLICKEMDAPLLSATVPYDEDDDMEYLTDPSLINERWGEEVDLILDAGIGGTETSTIVDCTNGEPEVVRQGKGNLI